MPTSLQAVGKQVAFWMLAGGLLFPLFFCGCSPDLTDPLAERSVHAQQDRALYDAGKPREISGLTLEQAVALAQKYNLDVWLARQQEAIQREAKSSSFLKMLPDLTFDFNAEERDTYNASSSVGLFTGQESQLTRYSYSADKGHAYGGMKLLWNALDFGVTYFRSKQEMNRQKQAGQERRRVAQKLASDVAAAYWQCVNYDRVAARAEVLQQKFEQELTNLQTSVKTGAAGSTDALERSYLLKTQKIRINEYLEQQRSVRLNLLQLLGLPLDARLTLAEGAGEAVQDDVAGSGYNVDELESKALLQRPEFFQEDLAEKITRDEARAVLLSMLPSPSLFLNPQADSNSYLYYNSWFNAGMNVSWNLFSIPGKTYEVKSNIRQLEFTRKKRMALAVAVITQVRLAVIEHDFAMKRYRLLQDLNADSRQMADNLEQSVKAGKAKGNAVVTQEARGLDDYARLQEAYARVMIARAHIAQSVGAEPAGGRAAELTGSWPAPAYATPGEEIPGVVSMMPKPASGPQAAAAGTVSRFEECQAGVVYVVGEQGQLIPKRTDPEAAGAK